MLSKIQSYVVARPWTAVLIAAAVGGVIALAVPAVARLLRPVARAVPGSKAA